MTFIFKQNDQKIMIKQKTKGEKMKELMMRLITEEEGQGMVEYGLIIALVALVVIGALSAMGGQLNTFFEAIKGKLVVPST